MKKEGGQQRHRKPKEQMKSFIVKRLSLSLTWLVLAAAEKGVCFVSF